MSAAPLAELMETVGQACLRFAEETRRREDIPATLTSEPDSDPVETLGLGVRQQEMVLVLRPVGDEGLTTAEICDRMGGYDAANAHMALRALDNRRVVEEVPGRRPIRWRLAHRYRATADPYLEMAEHVGRGEWTTYGDVSIAVRGNPDGARAVGRAAATLAHFPHPHRILWHGGQVPKAWKTLDSDTPNPEVCRQLLEDEGVVFDEHARASHEKYVPWHVLRERAGLPPLD